MVVSQRGERKHVNENLQYMIAATCFKLSIACTLNS
jgi:hypothetical protein